MLSDAEFEDFDESEEEENDDAPVLVDANGDEPPAKKHKSSQPETKHIAEQIEEKKYYTRCSGGKSLGVFYLGMYRDCGLDWPFSQKCN